MKTDAELVYAFVRGTTDQYMASLVMRGAEFAVFKIPGHSELMGARGCGMVQYIQTEYTLIRQGEWCVHARKKCWAGRVSKATLRAALEEVERRGKEAPE